MGRHPSSDSRPVHITAPVYEALVKAAEERLIGHHLLADRLLAAALADLTPVDAYGRPSYDRQINDALAPPDGS